MSTAEMAFIDTTSLNAGSTIISFIIFAEKRWLLSFIRFIYNRLTSKCYSMASVVFLSILWYLW